MHPRRADTSPLLDGECLHSLGLPDVVRKRIERDQHVPVTRFGVEREEADWLATGFRRETPNGRHAPRVQPLVARPPVDPHPQSLRGRTWNSADRPNPATWSAYLEIIRPMLPVPCRG